MPHVQRKSRARKATYIAFGLVVLAAASCASAEVRHASDLSCGPYTDMVTRSRRLTTMHDPTN